MGLDIKDIGFLFPSLVAGLVVLVVVARAAWHFAKTRSLTGDDLQSELLRMRLVRQRDDHSSRGAS